MLRLLLLVIILTTAVNTYAADNRRIKILNIISEELVEVGKISRQAGGNNPNLLLKKAELLLERGRLQLEAENERYLSLDPKTRTTANRERYFRTSKNSFREAKITCQDIIRKFPSYEFIGDVYFILAYYSKESGDYKSALVNFNKARVSTQNNKVQLKSEIAMAEIFYTLNQCDKAVKLYSRVIPKVDDKWKSKDLYNYGWCLYKTGNADQAIEALKESHRLSQKTAYIDMGSRVEKDIIIFYVSANRLKEGLSFINKKGRDKNIAIQELVKRLKDGGELAKAESLLKSFIKQTPANERAPYYLMLYKLYENLDWKKSAKLSLILKNEKLNASQAQEARGLALAKLSYIQNLLVKKRNESTLEKRAMAQAVEAHSLLAFSNDIKSNYKVSLAVAEAYNISGMNKKAFNSYMKSMEIAKSLKSSSLQKLSLDGALKTVATQDLNDLKLVYNKYLEYSPRGEKAPSIYEKLFQIHLQNKDLVSAEDTLKAYQKNFPRNLSKQEGMLALLFEQYQASGKMSSVRSWMSQINTGTFKVSPSYRARLTTLSNSIVEREAATLIKGGQWEKAIDKYKIAYSKNKDKETKADIALNIAQLYDSKKQTHLMKPWLEKSISLMGSKQVKNSEGILSTLLQSIFYNGYTKESFNLSQKAWVKSCRSMTLFKNAIVISKAFMASKNVKSLFRQARKCLPVGEINSLEASYNEELAMTQNGFNLREQNKLQRLKSIESSILKRKLSSNINTLSGQIKTTLSELSQINNYLSQIKNESVEKILGFQSLLSAYSSTQSKIQAFINKTKIKEVKSSLKPVLITLSSQRTSSFKRALSTISQRKNYTNFNHGLLRFLDIGKNKSKFRESL